MLHTAIRKDYEGSETTVTSVVRSGGAVDLDGQAQSREIMVGIAAQWVRPYRAMPCVVWNPTSGADVTVTVHGVASYGGLPNNDHIWMEVAYRDGERGVIATTTKADLLAASAPVGSDSASWVTRPTTFDGYSTLVALSNGNLTVLHNNNTASAGAISTIWHDSGKYYFEVKLETSVSANYIGIMSSAFANNFGTSAVAFDTTSAALGPGTGITSNGSDAGVNLGVAAVGDVFCFAIDLTARLAWVRRNNGNWNANASANPATATGGVLVQAAIAFAPFVRFGISASSTDQITANFGSAGAPAYAHTPPAGFGSWDTNWTAFKLEAVLGSPQPEAGYIEARVCVGRAAGIYYIDPKVRLTPGVGGTVNEAAAYTSSRYTYEGTETTESAIVRTDGAADPAEQQQSRKIVTTANAQWLRPFQAEPYAAWNGVSGEDVTVTVYGGAFGLLPNNDEIWMEVSYLGSSVDTEGATVTTTKTDLLAASVAVPVDNSVWMGEQAITLDGLKSANFTLSNGNLTVTTTNTAAASARSTAEKNAGKYYFEVTINTLTEGAASNVALGVVSALANLAAFSTRQDCVVVSDTKGQIHVNDVYSGFALSTLCQGDVIGVAVDFDNNKIWFLQNGGEWNGRPLGLDNPVTATGGKDASSVDGYAPAVAFGAGSGGSLTANFGATAFVGAIPSGFTAGWGSTATAFNGDIANVTRSNGNLTVTHANANAYAGAMSTNYQNTGKWYFEVTCTDVSVAAAVGVIDINGTDADGNFTDFMLGESGQRLDTSDGSMGRLDDTIVTYVGPVIANTTIGIAVDFASDRAWIRKIEGALWNGHPSHNPATNTGGISISPYSSTTMSPGVTASGVTGSSFTFNFGQTPYTYSQPAGFLNWGALTSFKLEAVLDAPQPGQAGFLEAHVKIGKPSATFYIDPQVELS